jgi:VanZ family protein
MARATLDRPFRIARGLLFYWGPLLLWFATILYLSGGAMSAEHTSPFVVPLVLRFCPSASPEAIHAIHVAVRKFGHLTEYALVALLAYRALRGSSERRWDPRWAAGAIAIAVACAGIDELRQSLVPSRTASLADVAVDAAGAALAMAALRLSRVAPST